MKDRIFFSSPENCDHPPVAFDRATGTCNDCGQSGLICKVCGPDCQPGYTVNAGPTVYRDKERAEAAARRLGTATVRLAHDSSYIVSYFEDGCRYVGTA